MNLHWHEQGCPHGWPAGEMLSDLMINRPAVQGGHLMDRKSKTQQAHQKTKGSKHPPAVKILFTKGLLSQR